jgi:hypothetical protein
MKFAVLTETTVTAAETLAVTAAGLAMLTGSGALALTFWAVPSTLVKATALAGVNKAGNVTGGFGIGILHQQRCKWEANNLFGYCRKAI